MLVISNSYVRPGTGRIITPCAAILLKPHGGVQILEGEQVMWLLQWKTSGMKNRRSSVFVHSANETALAIEGSLLD